MKNFKFESPDANASGRGIISWQNWAELQKLAGGKDSEKNDLLKAFSSMAIKLLEKVYLLHNSQSFNLKEYCDSKRAETAAALLQTTKQLVNNVSREPSQAPTSSEATTYPLAYLLEELSQDALSLVSILNEKLATGISREELQADLEKSVSAAASYDPEKDFRSEDKDQIVRNFLDKLRALADKLVRCTRSEAPDVSESLMKLLWLPLLNVNTFPEPRGWIRA